MSFFQHKTLLALALLLGFITPVAVEAANYDYVWTIQEGAVFRNDYKLEGLSAEGFEPVFTCSSDNFSWCDEYIKNKDGVWRIETDMQWEDKKKRHNYHHTLRSTLLDVSGFDLSSFGPLSYGFYKDKNTLYRFGEKVEKMSPKGAETFDCIDYSYENQTTCALYIKNNDGIFLVYRASGVGHSGDGITYPLEGVEIKNADRDTFVHFAQHVFKDKNSLYFYGETIRGISSQGVKVVDCSNQEKMSDCYTYIENDEGLFYLQSDVQAYKDGEIKIDAIALENIDRESFRYIKQNFIADKDGVYYFHHPILFDHNGRKERISPEEFEVLNDYYFKNKDGLYRNVKYTFTFEKTGFNNLFTRQDTRLKQKRLVDFIQPPHSDFMMDEPSHIRATIHDVLFEQFFPMDGDTFVLINRENMITKDKNHVYMSGRIISGADPDSFEKMKGYYYLFQDNNQVYSMKEPNMVFDKKSFVIGNDCERHDFMKDRTQMYTDSGVVQTNNTDLIKAYTGKNFFRLEDDIYYLDFTDFKKVKGADAESLT